MKEEIPDWKRVDLEKIREDLAIIDWEEEEDDMEVSCNKLEAKLLKSQERYVPKKAAEKFKYTPVDDSEYQGAIRKKLE